MVDRSADTIVACATPWGNAAVALLRMSGWDALGVARALCPGGPIWRPRRSSLRQATDGERVLDDVLATWMPGPRSYTGEDVVELGCHGSPAMVELLLDALVRCGARPARPGEFTRRALENGRIDLPRAEALAALVAASSPDGVRLARHGLDGAVSAEVASLEERLLDLASEIEARTDHPGEDLGIEDDAAVVAGLRGVAARAEAAADTWRAGRVRLEGARVAIVGPVNAGKSSLFNRLVGEARALVSPTPGTTRDVVERTVRLDGLDVTYLDIAGEGGGSDPIERAGLALGRALTADVDLRLVVLPLHRPARLDVLARTEPGPRIVVGTHLDLATCADLDVDLAVSNETGEGIDALRARVRAAVGGEMPSGARVAVVSSRQHELFRAVAERARAAADALCGAAGPAVASVEAHAALGRIGEIRGADVREEVLDRLFARFCVGK